MPEQNTEAVEKQAVERESTGHEFVRKIGPFGIVFFLGLFVFFLYWCFFSKPLDLLRDYEAPHSSEYYAQSPDTLEQLRDELSENVFPRLSGQEFASLEEDIIVVVLEDEYYEKSRDKILEYYDETLFRFERSEEQ